MLGCCCETRKHEFSFVGGVKDGARWGVNGDWIGGESFVAHGSSQREEMGCATRVGNGIKRSGGRTGYMGTLLYTSGCRWW